MQLLHFFKKKNASITCSESRTPKTFKKQIRTKENIIKRTRPNTGSEVTAMHSISPLPSFYSFGISSRFPPPRTRYIGHMTSSTAKKLSGKEKIQAKAVAKVHTRLRELMPRLLNAFIIYHESAVVLISRAENLDPVTLDDIVQYDSDSNLSVDTEASDDFWSFARAKNEDAEAIFQSLKSDLKAELGVVEVCIVFGVFILFVYPCTFFKNKNRYLFKQRDNSIQR